MVQEISVNELVFDTAQSRVKTEVTDSFVESVEELGILQNLVVRPDGNGKYIIIAGSRRYQAAREAGIDELPCKVVEANDQEAVVQSAIENLQRNDLTDYEAIRSVAMWYEMLEEDLVGEDEEVECPECGEPCEGRESYRSHISGHGEGVRKLQTPYLSNKQIHEKIASQTPFGVDTVRRLVKIGKLPEETLWLIKDEDERSEEEQQQVKNKLYSGFTVSTDTNSVVSNKALELAKFYGRVVEKGTVPRSLFNNLIYKTLSARNVDSNADLREFRRVLDDVVGLLSDWEGEVEDRVQIANAANGDRLPVERREAGTGQKETSTEEVDQQNDASEIDDSDIDGKEDSKKESTSWTDEVDAGSKEEKVEFETSPQDDKKTDDASQKKEEKKTNLGKYKSSVKLPNGDKYSINFNITHEEAELLMEKVSEERIDVESLMEQKAKELFNHE